jgi:hypothetical protein
LSHRAGQTIDDLCRACKTTRAHTIIAVEPDGRVARVACDFCGSQHNYRGGGDDEPRQSVERTEPERTAPRMSPSEEGGDDLERLLRRVLREELGLTAAAPAEKWRGGELVLRPGKPGLQEKKWPIDAFFHKVVMIRNRLRTLEQQINSLDVPEDVKVKMQGYITGCYGSLTSFNILFASEDDQFKGSGE